MPLDPQFPFRTFNFIVQITLPGGSAPLCQGSFSDCDGLEMSMEVKTIREGGDNARQIRLTGPVAYGQLVLKRGMTADRGLWDWFSSLLTNPSLRANVQVVMIDYDVDDDGDQTQVELNHFYLSNCVPVKMKAPALSAKDGLIAIEELQVAYETLSLNPPQAN
jgi:phage tail-like protein